MPARCAGRSSSSRASAAAAAARSRSVYAGASGSIVVDAPQSRRSYRTTWRPPRTSAAQSASGQESIVVAPASRTSGAAASPKCSTPSVTPLPSTVVMKPAPTQSRRWARGTTGPSDASSTSRTASLTGGAGSVADTLRVAASRACPTERRDPLAVAQMPAASRPADGRGAFRVIRSHASRRAVGGFWRSLQQQLGELLDRLGEGEPLAWPVVEFVGDGVELGFADRAEVGALGEVLAQEAVGVLVGAALPGRVRIAEEHLDAGVDADLLPVAHLGALVPGQRAAQRLGQRLHLGGERRRDVLGLVAVGQRHEHRVAA